MGDSMQPIHFSAVIKLRDINPYILMSAARVRAIKPGWRKPMPVLVRVNGKPRRPWRINMMPVGDGRFYLYLHAEVRQASDTKVGDRVQVEVGFDERYKNGPMHPMPSWFKAALRNNATAANNWAALVPSRKKEILRYFAGLKSVQARARNLQKAMHVLSDKQGRFMGREWNEAR